MRQEIRGAVVGLGPLGPVMLYRVILLKGGMRDEFLRSGSGEIPFAARGSCREQRRRMERERRRRRKSERLLEELWCVGWG